jgi:hypothetical protein
MPVVSQTWLGKSVEQELMVHNKDQQKAIEMIVEQNAGKKIEEQDSSDTDN